MSRRDRLPSALGTMLLVTFTTGGFQTSLAQPSAAAVDVVQVDTVKVASSSPPSGGSVSSGGGGGGAFDWLAVGILALAKGLGNYRCRRT
jgi:hypothetical protein